MEEEKEKEGGGVKGEGREVKGAWEKGEEVFLLALDIKGQYCRNKLSVMCM